jgi:hypothetical protein
MTMGLEVIVFLNVRSPDLKKKYVLILALKHIHFSPSYTYLEPGTDN